MAESADRPCPMTVVTLSQSESGVSLEARHEDTPKDILMITVTRCFWAAGVVLIATSLSAAGDSPAVAINSDRAAGPCDAVRSWGMTKAGSRRGGLMNGVRSPSSLSMVSGGARGTGTG